MSRRNHQVDLSKPLQSSSLAVYAAIEEHYSLNGFSPSYQQIMKAVGFNSKSVVNHHLKRLEAFGYIKREPNADRGVVPIHYPRVHYRRGNIRKADDSE